MVKIWFGQSYEISRLKKYVCLAPAAHKVPVCSQPISSATASPTSFGTACFVLTTCATLFLFLIIHHILLSTCHVPSTVQVLGVWE